MRLSLLPLTLVLALSLAACDTAEERAEKHFQSGMELLEAGDVDRALVELRNVFDLNGQHREARLVYARVLRERGQLGEAFGQYLRSAEQYPEEIESRRALAEMALDGGNWDEAERHGRAAAGLAPEDPTVRAVITALDYRTAVLARDEAAVDAAAAAAAAVAAEAPDQVIARRVLIDHHARRGETAAALAQVEAALALEPDSLEFHRMRLGLLASARDMAGIGAALAEMYDRFPDDEDTRRLLISWHLDRGDLDAAETVLRDIAAARPDEPGAAMAVVQFLQAARSPEAARTELDRLAAAGGPDAPLFRAARAAMDFDAGETGAAIAEMEEVLATAEASETTRNIKVALARMLEATGNRVGARARIEEVLAEEPGHVAALKAQAGWLIAEDRLGEAVLALRTALDQAPRDPEILTLMGRAHEREGARALAGERYALAVEVSGRRAAESLRYAEFLGATDQPEVAEGVLDDALSVAPSDLRLLVALAEVQMRRANWDRAEVTLARIRALGSEEAEAAANRLSARFLLRQERLDETVAFLESLAAGEGTGSATIAAIVQTQVRAGRIDEARATLDAELAGAPDDQGLRFLSAGLHAVAGEVETAETIYRALLDEAPGSDRVVRALHGLLAVQGRAEDATAVLDAGLAARPASGPLRLMKAAERERAGDFEGAIAIYEALYAENSDNVVVANNLASMLSAHRDDPESLERAAAVARRLRGLEVPAFQDTWGWIESRRGNHEEALPALQAAAQGLPQDPLVAYHLGMTYRALGRTAEARAELERMLELAGDSNPLPQVEAARTVLAGME